MSESTSVLKLNASLTSVKSISEKDISKNKSLFFKTKTLFVEWCKESSSHGIPNIASTDNLLIRIIWIFSFSLSLSYCCYLLLGTLFNYLSYPVYVKTELVSETPSLFPAISICNLDSFKTDEPRNEAEFDEMIRDSNVTLINSASYYLESITRVLRGYITNQKNQDKKNYGYDLKDNLADCKFSSYICSEQDFEFFYDPQYGNCYRFNANGSKYVGKTGVKGGLELEFYVGNYSNPKIYNKIRGIRFLVHNHTINTPLMDLGSNVAVGFQTNVNIKRTMYQKLGKPYSKCIDDLTDKSQGKTFLIEKLFAMLNITQYNREVCLNACYQYYLSSRSECNCSDPFVYKLPIPPVRPECISQTQIICQEKFFENFYTDIPSFCLENCPHECVKYEYGIEISQSEYLTEWYWNATLTVARRYANISRLSRKKISQINNLEEAKKSLLAINFFYIDLNLRKISDIPVWDTTAFLSSIGGNLGLFVGISLLSGVEIIDFAIRLILVLIKHLESNKKIKSKTLN